MERHYSACPHPYLQQASGQIFKDDVNGFSSNGYLLYSEGSQPFVYILNWNISVAESAHIAAVLDVFEVSCPLSKHAAIESIGFNLSKL